MIASVILKCRSYCRKCVVCQDRWSLMAVVSQDRFHCTGNLKHYTISPVTIHALTEWTYKLLEDFYNTTIFADLNTKYVKLTFPQNTVYLSIIVFIESLTEKKIRQHRQNQLLSGNNSCPTYKTNLIHVKLKNSFKLIT